MLCIYICSLRFSTSPSSYKHCSTQFQMSEWMSFCTNDVFLMENEHRWVHISEELGRTKVAGLQWTRGKKRNERPLKEWNLHHRRVFLFPVLNRGKGCGDSNDHSGVALLLHHDLVSRIRRIYQPPDPRLRERLCGARIIDRKRHIDITPLCSYMPVQGKTVACTELYRKVLRAVTA